MIDSEDYDFSFSGLKTAVLYWVEAQGPEAVLARRADLCASFQAAVVDVLVEKLARATRALEVPTVLLAGGVACNGALREATRARLGDDVTVLWPRPIHCTDNGAMIARTAVLHAGEAVGPGDFDVLASLPLGAS